MSIVQGQTTRFKTDALSGLVNFAVGTSYVYKIALYTANADLNNTTSVYTTTGEVTGTGYTAGGKTLVVSTVPTGDNQNNVSYVSFDPVVWTAASFTCRGALIYNSTTNATVAVLNFGSDKTTTNTFTLTFPTPGSTTAVLTIS
jgi:integral membrane sensor domain MASE1